MSVRLTSSVDHAEYVKVGPAFNTWDMRGLSWLDESRVWRGEPAGFNERVELRPLIRPDLPGFLAAELPGGYLVEFRTKEGVDSEIDVPAARVHTFEGESSYVMKGAFGKHYLAHGDFFLSEISPGPTRG